jgi:carbon monoxide dehydrogenase subunit G
MADDSRQFSGFEIFTVEPARLYATLTDLDMIAQTIPDLVSSERVDAQTLKCVVRPGFSFLRGTLKTTISLADLQPPNSATMNVAAQSIGVSIRIQSRLRISAEGTGSRLDWEAAITEMKGLVASVSPGLVTAAADQVLRHGWQQVHARLDG